MRIEFDPTNPDEAAAVRAMLTAMHPQEWTGKTLTARFEEPTEEKVHSEDGGMTVNLTDGTVTVASDTDSVPDLDSNGEPWDARIHSTPAKTNADGTWRAKRGVKAEEIAAVRAEREAQATEEAHIAILDAAAVAEPGPVKLAEETVEEHFAEVEQIVASAPPAPPTPLEAAREELVAESREYMAVPTPPPAPDSPIATGGPSFLDVMKAITAAQKDGKIDTAKVKELCAAVGAGESTMGLNGADKGELRVAFMALLSAESGE